VTSFYCVFKIVIAEHSFKNFLLLQIVLGVVTSSACLVLANSDAESDPGTHYVNTGVLGRPAGYNFAGSDVNQYGYKHSYGIVPPRKRYGYSLKTPAPVVPLQPVQPVPHVAPAPLVPSVPNVAPAPLVPSVPNVAPALLVPSVSNVAPLVQPIPHAVTPAPLGSVAVSPVPLFHSTPSAVTPFVRLPGFSGVQTFTPAPAPVIPQEQPVVEQVEVHQETVPVGEVVQEVRQPFPGAVRFPPHPVFDRVPVTAFPQQPVQPVLNSVPAAVAQPIFSAAPLPDPQQPVQPIFNVAPEPVPLPAPEPVQAPVTISEEAPIEELAPTLFPSVDAVPAFESERLPPGLPVLEAVPTQQPFPQGPLDPRFAPAPPGGAPLFAQGPPPPAFFGLQEIRQDLQANQEVFLEDPEAPMEPAAASVPSPPTFHSLPAFPAVPL